MVGNAVSVSVVHESARRMPARLGRAAAVMALAFGLLACGGGSGGSVFPAPQAGGGTAASGEGAGEASSAKTVLYASPTGGAASACSQGSPCGLGELQQAVRKQLAAGATDVEVQLADGTYRLSSTWQFGAADSGTPGHPVVWTAAPGAHPVISGATEVTGWRQAGTSGIWSAAVPANSNSRQLYIDGKAVPVAQKTPARLGFKGGWRGSSTGYDISGDTAATTWFAGLSAAQVAGVEFVYPAGNGQWTESRCRVASYAAGQLMMTEPCWTNVTKRLDYAQASGSLPSMNVSTMPASIRNALALVQPGQWFLDAAASTLHYQPIPGQNMAALHVELPRLESLLLGAGTLANPLHDVTFSGLQFSYATWNDPSTNAGFSEVQANLRMTIANNQGMCNFSSPAGTCPWGALTQPLANVSFSASNNITLSGNRFVNLGGAGLAFMYGSSNNLIQGNEFTEISSTGILLGCTYDPTPLNPANAAAIKQNCNPNPLLVANDLIGANEIMTGNTVSDNLVHRIGTDYPSACGITLLFSRGTKIVHNHIYDVPYTGITAGVIQGHVDNAAHPQNSVNINGDNTISNNLIHDYLQVLHDGGAIYIEGHQAQYRYKPDGITVDPVATLAHGMQVVGNVAFNGHNTNFTYYDDAGSEWINWQGNAAFNAGEKSGGCSATGHIWVTGNYLSSRWGAYECDAPVDVNESGNVSIAHVPQPGDIPAKLLSDAGVTPAFRTLGAAMNGKVFPVSVATSSTPKVIVAGRGFLSSPPIFFDGVKATNVEYLSDGLLFASIPAGGGVGSVTVGAQVAAPAITSPVNNSIGLAASRPIAGTGVAGSEVTVADGTDLICLATVAGDGTWNCAAVLADGIHTLAATQRPGDASGSGSAPSTSVAVLVGSARVTGRINDDHSAILYSSGWTPYTAGGANYADDIHYATQNGETVTLVFTGTAIQVFGEKVADQGDMGISIDGGAQQVVSTLAGSGPRSENAIIFTSPTLASGTHVITLTKLSGQYATFDGFNIATAATGFAPAIPAPALPAAGGSGRS